MVTQSLNGEIEMSRHGKNMCDIVAIAWDPIVAAIAAFPVDNGVDHRAIIRLFIKSILKIRMMRMVEEYLWRSSRTTRMSILTMPLIVG